MKSPCSTTESASSRETIGQRGMRLTSNLSKSSAICSETPPCATPARDRKSRRFRRLMFAVRCESHIKVSITRPLSTKFLRYNPRMTRSRKGGKGGRRGPSTRRGGGAARDDERPARDDGRQTEGHARRGGRDSGQRGSHKPADGQSRSAAAAA